MTIKTIDQWQMNHATGLEEEDTGIIIDARDDESKEHISQVVDESPLAEAESDINYAQGGERPALLFSTRNKKANVLGPEQPKAKTISRPIVQ